MRWFILALLIVGSGQQALAGEKYYVAMFGAQRTPNTPAYSHSWAAFVKVSWRGMGPCPPIPTVELVTISWLPDTGVLNLLALSPEPGRNWELHETMRWAVENNMRISMWGAYRIEPELYFRAVRQLDLLAEGSVRYKANDFGYARDRATNCVHALTPLLAGPRPRTAILGWGDAASYSIVKDMEPWIRDATSEPWVAQTLGLDSYPITFRDAIAGSR